MKKKTNNLETEKNLIDLSGKVKLISTRGLTKDLINGYSILNGVKYFFWESWTTKLFSISISFKVF